jgi:serine/threonine-protein kinase
MSGVQSFNGDGVSESGWERIVRACNRYEDAWRSGRRPRVEDYLGEVTEPERPVLLRELLVLELELRRGRGERPTAEEYRARFPGHGDLIAAALRQDPQSTRDTRPRPRAQPTDPDPVRQAGHNLLFGVLALQNDFIGRDDLLAAFAAWVADKALPLAQLLVDRGALDEARRALLEALVGEHLKRHGGDPEASLAAVSSLGSVGEDLERLGDPDLQASLAATASRSAGPAGDPGATATHTPSARRAGQRFRILHFHREGGLGRVYVARDEELGRDVALKEIRPDKVAEADLRGRFVLEAEINGGLEHPGIVPVYSLGAYDDGRPFYAMRFVEGDSLKEAIAAYHLEHPRPDPSAVAFRKLLGRFVDVCEAIAFAHSKGVLHRDLKPHNVMLGRFGETLLIDWGLAKATGRCEPVGLAKAPEATLVPRSGSGHAPTHGVLGSPPYMSPEQAAGAVESLGPATDVYGLGAILFALLTGEPPVEGGTADEILDRARRGAIRPPRSLNPNIPRALEAACLKALALKPEDRYPSSRALADDLEHWLADEPVSAHREGWAERLARWTRRHRAWAQAGAAALLAVAVIATISALVVDGARRGEKAARGEVTRSLVAERAAKAAADASLEQANVNLGLARQAVEDYFTRVSQDTLLKRQDAPSVRDLRELRKDLLDVALRYYQTFVAKYADDPALQAELARAYGRVGEITSEIGSKERALEAHRQALALWSKLAGASPGEGETQRGLATSHFHIGLLQRQLGRSAEALASYDRSRAIAERIAVEHPELPIEQDLGKTLDNRGNVLSDLGRRADAMESYQRALAVYERLAAAEPTNAGYQVNVASVSHNIGVEHAKARRAAEALADFDRARAIRERLAAAHPTVSEYQNLLAQSYKNIGVLNADTNHPAEALRAFERARQIQVRLVAENPTVTQFQSDLANTLTLIGRLHRRTGQPDKALASYAEAGAILTRLVDLNPSVERFQGELSAVWNNTANIHAESGRFDEALAGLERARVLDARLVADHPELPDLRHDVGILDNNIGALHFQAGRLDAALAAAERGRALLEAVAAENPQVSDYRRNQANSHNVIGAVHLQAGRLDQALGSFERARAIRAGLAADHPAILQYKIDLAESLSNIGSLQARSRRLREALASYEQAREILAKLAESDPSHATVRHYLATTYNEIAGVRSVLGPRDEARASAERARALLEPLPRPLPDELYQLARAHCLSAYLDSPDPTPTTDEERARREAHADRAVALLRRAIGAGYRDVAELQFDPSWGPIRQRPDFQLMLSDLTFPANPFVQ